MTVREIAGIAASIQADVDAVLGEREYPLPEAVKLLNYALDLHLHGEGEGKSWIDWELSFGAFCTEHNL
jgi:hypothetical protein